MFLFADLVQRLPKNTTIEEAKNVSVHGCCRCIYPISTKPFFASMDLEGKVPMTCKLERHQFAFQN
jgi:hypothetical protein